MRKLTAFLLSICMITNNWTLIKAESNEDPIEGNPEVSLVETTPDNERETEQPEITPEVTHEPESTYAPEPTLFPITSPAPEVGETIPNEEPSESQAPTNSLPTPMPSDAPESKELTVVDFVNPEYPDIEVDFDVLHQRSEIALFASENEASDFQSAVNALTNALINRENSISITFPFGAYPDPDTVIMTLMEQAMAYDNNVNPEAGDYLQLNYRGWSGGGRIMNNRYTLTYTVEYMTDQLQEKQTGVTIAQLLFAKYQVDKMERDIDKFNVIYDYVTTNVAYDYTYSKYDAYNALINHSAVCQGYALLMYRMLSAAGLKTRIITGGNHAWNIVKIDGQWYNLDSTWDAGSEGNYRYYLKSDNAFSDHYRKEKYKTEEFYAQFPMSPISYGEEVEETPIYLHDLDFGTLTSTTGEAIRYQQLERKSRIYLFFSKDCGNCQFTLEELKQSGVIDYPYVEILLFEVNEYTDQVVNSFLKSKGLENYTAISKSSKLLQQYMGLLETGQITYPLLVIADPNGNIRYWDDEVQEAEEFNQAVRLMKESAYYVPLTGIETMDISIKKSGSQTLPVTLIPEKVSDQRLSYFSENENVAAVDEYGTVTGINTGTTKIHVISKENPQLEKLIEVTVYQPITDLMLNDINLEMEVGSSQAVSLTISPVNWGEREIAWSSLNETVLTVEGNSEKVILHALKSGYTLLSAEIDGIKVTKILRVLGEIDQPQDLSVWQNESGDIVIATQDQFWKENLLTDGAENVVLENESGRFVVDEWLDFNDQGELVLNFDQLLKLGVTAGNYHLTLYSPYYQLLETELELKLGAQNVPEDLQLIQQEETGNLILSTANEEYGTHKTEITLISELGIEYHFTQDAKVGNVLVAYSELLKQNLKKGIYQVVISSYGFAVWKGEIRIDKAGIFAENGENTYYTGQKLQLETGTGNGEIKWSSSNSNIAAIDKNGQLTFKAAGTVKITAKYPDLSQTFTVKVIKSSLKITVDNGKALINTPQVLHVERNVEDPILWSISDPEVLTLDEETRTVTGKKPGTAKLTATMNGISSALTITVYSIDAQSKLSISLDDYPSQGLELGEERQIKVIGSVGEEEVKDRVTLTSSNTKVAEIDENGKLKAVGIGSATITATVKDDPAKRKVTMRVKVIARQVGTIQITMKTTHSLVTGEMTEGSLRSLSLDARDVRNIKNGIEIELNGEAKDSLGNTTATKLNWSTTDSNVAAIAVKNGKVILTLKQAGTVTISAAANDLYKKQESFTVQIKDYEPRISTNTVTLNPAKTRGETIQLYPTYDNEITGAELLENGVLSMRFKAEKNGEIRLLDENVKNGSYKSVLRIETKYGSYEYAVTVKVAKSTVSPGVKLNEKLNLFYRQGEITATLDHKGNTVESMKLEGTEAFERNFEIDAKGRIQIHGLEKEANGKLNLSGTLVIQYREYKEPVRVKITIPTITTKPSYSLEKTSVTVNPNQGEKEIAVQILDTKTKKPIDLTGLTIRQENVSGNASEALRTEDGKIWLKLTGKSGKMNIVLQGENWTSALKYSFSVNTSTAAAKASAKKTTLNLYNSYLKLTDESEVVMNLANVGLSLTRETLVPSVKNENTDKIEVIYENGRIQASLLDSTMKAGNYSYSFIPKDENGKELPKITVTIKVNGSAVALKLSATGTINLLTRESSFVTVTPSITNQADSVGRIELIGEEAKRFEAKLNEAGKIEVRAKAGVKLESDKTYELSFKATGVRTGEEFYSTVKIKTGQSYPGIKLNTSTITMYCNVTGESSRQEIGFRLTSQQEAKIESLELMGTALQEASFGYELVKKEDGSYGLELELKDGSGFKAGSSQTLKFKVVYEDMAENTKNYSIFQITVKLAANTNAGSYTAKESLRINGADRVYYKVGETLKLKAWEEEEEAEVVWYTNNASLATVTETGEVTLKGAGTIIVYAKGEGQKLGSISLTVYAANIIEPQVIKLNTNKLSLMSDKTARLSVSFDPSRTDSRLKRLIWESDNEEVATVNASGVVTAKKAGVTTIRVRSAALPQLTAEAEIAVTAPLTLYQFLETSSTSVNMNLIVNETETIEILARTKDGSQPNISWKNSDESVIQLSAEGKLATIKALKPGKSTITIQCADKTLTKKITVYPVNNLSSIRVSIENYSAAGLELGEERQIKVIGSVGEEEVKDRVTLTSSNTKVAEIDENGKLKAVGIGSATITATVKDDPAKRKVTMRVKVIARQVGTIQITMKTTHSLVTGEMTEGSLRSLSLDARDVRNIKNGIEIELNGEAKDSLGNTTATKLNWSTTDSNVAAIAVKNGKVILTLKQAGTVTISAAANDLYKKQESFTVQIKDYEPRISTNTVTLNPAKTRGETIQLYPTYDNEITGAELLENGVLSMRFKAEKNGEIRLLDENVKNGSYKSVLRIETKYGSYEYAVTVKVAKSTVSPGVKLNEKLNLFYRQGEITATLDHKGNTVESMKLEGTEAFERNFEIDAKGRIQIHGLEKEANGKLNLSGTLVIQYREYKEPVRVKITIPTITTKPSYSLEKTSVTVNPNQGEKEIAVQILDTKTKKPIDLTGLTIRQENVSGNASEALRTEDGKIWLKLTGKSGKMNIVLQGENWTSALKYSFSVNTSTAAAKASAKKTTLNLYNSYLKLTDESEVVMNLANVGLSLTRETLVPSVKNENTDKIEVIYENGRIQASLLDSTMKAGNYSYSFIPKDENGKELPKITVTIKVNGSAVALKLSATGTINLLTRESSFVTVTPSITNQADSVGRIELIGEEAKRFEAKLNEAGKIEVRAKAGVKLESDKTYELSFKATGVRTGEEFYSTVKIKTGQSYPGIKLNTSTITMYSNVTGESSRQEIGFRLTSQQEAKIESLELMGTALQEASFGYELVKKEDGSYGLELELKDGSGFKAGSSQTLKFKVVYEDMAENTKNYSTFQITVKLAANTNAGSYTAKESLRINGADRVYYKVGETLKLKAWEEEEEAEVVWYTNNASLATVTETGEVTLKGAGTIIVYAKGEGQKLGSISLTVYAANIIEPQAIKLNLSEVNVLVGKTSKLSVSFIPSNTDSRLRGITWTSDNESIAKVSSNGTVTGVGEGQTTIHATTITGYEVTCRVYVTYRKWGIDVSKYQGYINWGAVKASGVDYAIIRAMSENTNGVYIDPYFKTNVINARNAGIKVGAYYYTYSKSTDNIIAELSLLFEALKDLEYNYGIVLDYPVYVDMEDSSFFKFEPSWNTYLLEYALGMLTMHGYYAGIYTYTNFANNALWMNSNQIKDYDVWIADWRGYVGYQGHYEMWQYTNSGYVNGISGRVDMSYCYKNYPEIINNNKLNYYH
ncbi:hypothetical protein GKE09_09445 [Holdemania massiliensis]|nr:hypothetical protein [Holdemania massiliensis]